MSKLNTAVVSAVLGQFRAAFPAEAAEAAEMLALAESGGMKPFELSILIAGLQSQLDGLKGDTAKYRIEADKYGRLAIPPAAPKDKRTKYPAIGEVVSILAWESSDNPLSAMLADRLASYSEADVVEDGEGYESRAMWEGIKLGGSAAAASTNVDLIRQAAKRRASAMAHEAMLREPDVVAALAVLKSQGLGLRESILLAASEFQSVKAEAAAASA